MRLQKSFSKHKQNGYLTWRKQGRTLQTLCRTEIIFNLPPAPGRRLPKAVCKATGVRRLLFMKTFIVESSREDVESVQVVVDDCYFEWLSSIPWTLTKKDRPQFTYSLHGIISVIPVSWMVIGHPPIGFEVDHADGNPLNNRLSNLRFCTHAQNMKNRKLNANSTSGAKGVSFSKRNKDRMNPWVSRIMIDGKRRHLGQFSTLVEAQEAYWNAAKKFHGEFARLK